MQDSPEPRPDPAGPDWPGQIHQALRAWQVRQVAYVPDAGHSRLIELCHADPEITPTVLSTEEEGIALLAGAWLGGQRGVLLMQSSGVGNCINMLSLVKTCRLPFVTLVTMRGEWGEFNPWQVPMGSTTCASLELAGVTTYRVEHADAVRDTVDVALAAAYDTQQAAAVILSQKLLGRKKWTK